MVNWIELPPVAAKEFGMGISLSVYKPESAAKGTLRIQIGRKLAEQYGFKHDDRFMVFIDIDGKPNTWRIKLVPNVKGTYILRKQNNGRGGYFRISLGHIQRLSKHAMSSMETTFTWLKDDQILIIDTLPGIFIDA